MQTLHYILWRELFALALWLEGHAIRFRDLAQRRKMALVTEVPGERRAW